MKKFLSVLLAVIMCVLPLATSVGAVVPEGKDVLYTISDASVKKVDVTADTTVTVTISIESATELNSIALSKFEYDKDALEFVEFSDFTAELKGLLLFPTMTPDSKNMAVTAAIRNTTFTEPVEICSATFKVKTTAGVGEYDISCDVLTKAGSTPLISVLDVATVSVLGIDFPDSLEINDKKVTYDSEVHTIEVENLPDGASVEYTCNGRAFNGTEDAGTYEVTATVTADGYNKWEETATLEIEQKDLTVKVTVPSKEYDGTTTIENYTDYVSMTGLIEGDDVELNIGELCYDIPDAVVEQNVIGNVGVNGSDVANYNVSYDRPMAKITPKPITVKADDVVVRVGADMPAEYTYTATGLVEGDTLREVTLKVSSKANTNAEKEYPITITVNANYNRNYTITTENGIFKVILKDEQGVNIPDIADVTYGEDSFNLGVTLESNVTASAVEYESLTPDVVSVDGDGNVTIVGAGEAEIAITKAGDETYADVDETVTFDVEKKKVTVTADDVTVMKGDEIPAKESLTYKVDGLVYDDVASEVFTGLLTTTARSSSTVKDYPISQGTLKANANYTIEFVPGTLSVIDKTKQDITVTSNLPSGLTYGDDGFKIDVAYGAENVSENETTFASTNEEVATVDAEGNVKIIGAGEAVVTVARKGTDTLADFSEEIEVVVAKKPITITAVDNSKKENNPDPALTYEVTGELVSGDTISGNVAREEGEEVGEYEIGIGTLSLSSNYDVTFVKGTFTIFDKTPQEITVAQTSFDKTYGDDGFTLDVTYGTVNVSDEQTTFASSDEAVATVDAEGNVVIVGAGEAEITIARKGNDDLADFEKTVNVTVAKRAITVTADAKEKYVDQDTPALTYSYEGTLVGSDAFTGELTVADGNRAGRSYDIKLGNLALGDNYELTYVGAKLKVNAKVNQDITVSTTMNLIYGDKGFGIEVVLVDYNEDEAISFVSSDEEVATVDEDGNITVLGAGRTTVTVSVAGNYKYNDFTKNVTVNVAKKEAFITANDVTVKQGSDMPTFTAEVEGVIDGETLDYSLTTTATDTSEIDDYVIKVVLGDNPNYDIDTENGTFSVVDKTPQQIAVGNVEDVTYGDTGVKINYSLGDAVTASPVVFTSEASDVATVDNDGNVTIVGAGDAVITVTKAGDEDYADFAKTVEFEVAKKTASITANSEYVKIGRDMPAFTAEVEGVVDGDTLNYTLETNAADTNTLGNFDIVVVLGDNPNYDILTYDATLTVIEKDIQTITIEGYPEDITYGDDPFEFTVVSDKFDENTINITEFTILDSTAWTVEKVDGTNNKFKVTVVGAGDVSVEFKIAGNEDVAEEIAYIGDDINQKELTVTSIDLDNKTAVLDGIVGEDLVEIDFASIVITLGEAIDENTSKATVSNILLVGDDADNYGVMEGTAVETTVANDNVVNVSVVVENEKATVTGAGTYLKGGEAVLVATPDRGYKVSAWKLGEETLGTENTLNLFDIDEDVEITLVLKKTSTGGGGGGTPTRTVYFRVDENTTNSVTVDKGSKVAKPADPTLEGYTFGGWYTDEDCTEEYDFDKAVDMSITLYAKWTEIEKDDDDKDDEGKDDEGGDDVADAWDNPYSDVDEADWFYDVVKTVSQTGIMNGVSDDEFVPDMLVTRGMIVTMIYRAESEPVAINDVSFEDVDDNAYYSSAVAWASENGIVNGFSETEFAPESNVTREQIATIVFRYAAFKGITAVNASENLFFDDADDISEYAVAAMNWLVANNIITGYEDGTVKPQGNATRAEVAAMTARILEYFAQ